MHPSFYLSSVSWLLLIFYQYLLIQNYDRDKCLLAFKNNSWVGFSLLVGSVLGTAL
tara:strand:- start:685 stop:852 length:168 start_codon:yes stop_codon:yes gene_type:complete